METLHRCALAVLLVACSSAREEPAYPSETHVEVGASLPVLHWTGIDTHGDTRTIALHEWYAPNEASRVLVVRIDGGAWCGTCRWHATHDAELANESFAARIAHLDLVLGDADNTPVEPSELPEWRALVGDASSRVIAADPGFSLRSLVPDNGAPLPLYAFVDTRTMKLTGTLSNPGPEKLAGTIEATLAKLDGRSPPPARTEARIDGFFRRDQWDMIRDMQAPGAPPPDPTNAHADDPAAAALGKTLFSDAALSPSGKVSCATCHSADTLLSDERPVAHGVADGTRRTPRIALAAHARSQFWDGRADSLWSQALGPFENPLEMNASRAFVAQQIASRHRDAYAAAFDADFSDDTRVFVNAGKAIEAYERTFRISNDRFDRHELSTTEKQGLSLFAQVGCMQCHWGPRLTDDAFHVVHASTPSDRGHIDGKTKLLASEFHGGSRWSDSPRPPRSTPGTLGAFKTPSLRGIAHASHFGHGGTEADLVTVTELYGQRGIDDPSALGTIEPWLLSFDVTAQWAIPAFLGTLDGVPIVP